MFVERLPPDLAVYRPASVVWRPDFEKRIVLDPALVEGLVKTFLAERFDRPQPTQPMHRAMWELCTGPDPKVAIAAPRGHSKSTSVTHAYTLSELLFQSSDYALIVSDTEAQGVSFLSDIKMELSENELLMQAFHIRAFIKDSETELVVVMKNGHQFKIAVRGAAQKVRGLKWRGKRPNLIVIDDSENDDMVMNQDRREKFRHWFMNALLPAGSDDCRVRMVGTIMHDDSLLERFMSDSSWTSLRLDAHSDDYSEILWQGKFTRERLESLYESYKDQGNTEGYSMEYRNQPIDSKTAFFRKQDLLELIPEMRSLRGQYYTGVDLAISLATRSDFTVIVTAKMVPGRGLQVVDIRRGHWESPEIIEQLIEVQKRYRPEVFYMEGGAIEKSIGPFLYEKMHKEGVYLNIEGQTPVKDKMARAQSFKARVRAGSVFFDKEADWYPVLEKEMTSFPRGRKDDQVDALSWIGLALDDMLDVDTEEEEAAADWKRQEQEHISFGRSAVTGY